MDKKVKKTTYQKLKEERIKLLNDIRIMVMNPNSISEVEVRTKYASKSCRKLNSKCVQ